MLAPPNVANCPMMDRRGSGRGGTGAGPTSGGSVTTAGLDLRHGICASLSSRSLASTRDGRLEGRSGTGRGCSCSRIFRGAYGSCESDEEALIDLLLY